MIGRYAAPNAYARACVMLLLDSLLLALATMRDCFGICLPSPDHARTSVCRHERWCALRAPERRVPLSNPSKTRARPVFEPLGGVSRFMRFRFPVRLACEQTTKGGTPSVRRLACSGGPRRAPRRRQKGELLQPFLVSVPGEWVCFLSVFLRARRVKGRGRGRGRRPANADPADRCGGVRQVSGP